VIAVGAEEVGSSIDGSLANAHEAVVVLLIDTDAFGEVSPLPWAPVRPRPPGGLARQREPRRFGDEVPRRRPPAAFDRAVLPERDRHFGFTVLFAGTVGSLLERLDPVPDFGAREEFLMWIGRLEIIPVLPLLTSGYWRSYSSVCKSSHTRSHTGVRSYA